MSVYKEELVGVTEYGEGYPVTLEMREDQLVLCAVNESGYNGVAIDFVQLINWLKINKPGFLKP